MIARIEQPLDLYQVNPRCYHPFHTRIISLKIGPCIKLSSASHRGRYLTLYGPVLEATARSNRWVNLYNLKLKIFLPLFYRHSTAK
jgi:hypothetical protein